MSRPITSAGIPNVPGVEQLDAPLDGASRFLGPYYTDEITKMVEAARSLRPRERYFIAPDGDNFSIYRRAAK